MLFLLRGKKEKQKQKNSFVCVFFEQYIVYTAKIKVDLYTLHIHKSPKKINSREQDVFRMGK